MRHIFTIYHPAVLFLYIVSAAVCAMLTLQPLYVAISFACGSAYAVYLVGARQYFSTLKWMLVMFAAVAVLNPLFNQRGFTILFRIGNNPFTLEALCYGLCAGGMLLCVFVWFVCYNALITNEKFLHLFGSLLPTAALMVSMILKLIPQVAYRARCVKNAQEGLCPAGQKNWRERAARSVRMAGVLMSWSMEDSVETADSMRARGYGTVRHTSFSRFRFTRKDAVLLGVLCALLAANLFFIFRDAQAFAFYPTFRGLAVTPGIYLIYAGYLCFPLLLEGKERLLWRP